jgi:hypothetical protein
MYQSIEFHNLTPAASPLPQFGPGIAASLVWFRFQAAKFAPETISSSRFRQRDIHSPKRTVLAIYVPPVGAKLPAEDRT